MVVKFYYKYELLKEVMLTIVPTVGDSIVIDKETYNVNDIIYNFDENYFVRVELT